MIKMYFLFLKLIKIKIDEFFGKCVDRWYIFWNLGNILSVFYFFKYINLWVYLKEIDCEIIVKLRNLLSVIVK